MKRLLFFFFMFLSMFSHSVKERSRVVFIVAYKAREICCFSNSKSMLTVQCTITPCKIENFQLRFSPCTVHFPGGLLEILGFINPGSRFLWFCCLGIDRIPRIKEKQKYCVKIINELFCRFYHGCKRSQDLRQSFAEFRYNYRADMTKKHLCHRYKDRLMTLVM